MQFVTYRANGSNDRLGLVDGGRILDLAVAARARNGDASPFSSMHSLLATGEYGLEGGQALRSFARERDEPQWWTTVADARLRPPVPAPPKIICLAGNYAEHVREAGLKVDPKATTTPLLFSKPLTTLIGHEDSIRLPGPLCTSVDYEGELVAVIGRIAHEIQAQEALDYVAGYTCFNDVSGRRLTIEAERQMTERIGYFDWLSGKWFDTFGPCGPTLVTADEVPDPQCLTLTTRVNGHVRQRAGTAEMIFGVAETIAWISRFVTLQPGDLVATGTPSGVGSSTGTFLRDGDTVEVEVSQLGTLRNAVTA